MSRWDVTGLFWDDYIAPRVRKEKIKREAPAPIWLDPAYLPDLERAQNYKFELMTDAELIEARDNKDRLIWDTEFYPNYALVGFRNMRTDKLLMFESTGHNTPIADLQKLKWVTSNFTLVGFNDNNFDIPMLASVLAGHTTEQLYKAVVALIVGDLDNPYGMKPFVFYRNFKLRKPVVDNIDLIELTPLGPSLKICAGRIHSERMADLPYLPGTYLTADQITVLRYYWTNDLNNTLELYNTHKTAIELRELLTAEYKVDVRSKSDPQIAEAVIRAEIERLTGNKRIEKATIIPGRRFKFKPPPYIRFQTTNMKWVLDFIKGVDFEVENNGSVALPDALAAMDVPIGNSIYRMGAGGLHSSEKRTVHYADELFELTDNDVTSYYPSLIIQQGMYPPNVGPVFLTVFKRIYDRRINAKRTGDKNTAETLKIVLNGTFGKTGERGGHSVVYYPEMMIQTTLSGQLALLMLIEWLEMNGIHVVSANTDGILVKCPRPLIDLKNEIMRYWEQQTGLGLESAQYKAVFSRDVNNYVALYADEPAKIKDNFSYGKAIGVYRKVTDAYPPKWNPTCDICASAAIGFLAKQTPVEKTIREATDMRLFLEVRRVNGGAYKDGEYLGKAIRWYYSTQDKEPIINAKNGHTVPRSEGARAYMTRTEGLPDDLDYDYYIERALGMVAELTGEEKKKK